MSKLVLKYDFTDPKYRSGIDILDASGGGNKGTITSSSTLYESYKGKDHISFNGKNTRIKTSAAPIPVGKPYYIKIKMYHRGIISSTPGSNEFQVIFTTTDNMKYGGSQLDIKTTTPYYLGFADYQNGWKNFVSAYPTINNATELVITIVHDNVVDGYVSIYNYGQLLGKTKITNITASQPYFPIIGGFSNMDSNFLYAYMSLFEVYEGLYIPEKYNLLLDSITNDVFSFNGTDIIKVGTLDTINLNIFYTKGISMEIISKNILPKQQSPFKILTI